MLASRHSRASMHPNSNFNPSARGYTLCNHSPNPRRHGPGICQFVGGGDYAGEFVQVWELGVASRPGLPTEFSFGLELGLRLRVIRVISVRSLLTAMI